MKLQLLLALVALPWLGAEALAPGSDTPTFAPASGSELRKTFSERTRWEVTEIAQRVNGQDQDLRGFEMAGRFHVDLDVLDEYGEVADGRPLGLKRAVRAAEGSSATTVSSAAGDEAYDTEFFSPLAAEVVVFEWNEEELSYAAELEEPGAADAFLDALAEDMDLRGLLPNEAVAEGDSWELGVDALTSLLRPGGAWSLRPAAMPSGAYVGFELEDVLAGAMLGLAFADDELDGEGTARWTSTRAEDGHRLAVIELRFEVVLAADSSVALEDGLRRIGHETGRGDLSLRVEWTLEGEGELLWNLEADRFESFEVELEGTAEARMGWMLELGQAVLTFELEAELGTDSVLAGRVEPD